MTRLAGNRAAVEARLAAAGCVYAGAEADLLLAAAATPTELSALVERRVTGVPLEHVLGWAQFCGLRLSVVPGVFVPRARTGLLVREAVRAAGGGVALGAGGAVVLDLCCGCGAVGAAVAATAGHPVRLYAADIDPAAVACARRNLAPFGGRVYQGDLFAPLPAELRGRVDVLVANLPYVPTGELGLLPPEARLHEPGRALDGGADGLDPLRRLAAQVPGWLGPAGQVLVEAGRSQAPVAAGILAGAGLTPRVVRDQDLDATVIAGGR